MHLRDCITEAKKGTRAADQRVLLPADPNGTDGGSVTGVQSPGRSREGRVGPGAGPLFCPAHHVCRQYVVALRCSRQHGSVSRIIHDRLCALLDTCGIINVRGSTDLLAPRRCVAPACRRRCRGAKHCYVRQRICTVSHTALMLCRTQCRDPQIQLKLSAA